MALGRCQCHTGGLITKIYDVSIKAIVLGRQCKKTKFVSPSPLAPLRFLS